uniref:Secreted protein n=1 Tax=Phakopsora pachyrhizi TaxID=170000 RepID=A0A0S1MJY2_PHAPC
MLLLLLFRSSVSVSSDVFTVVKPGTFERLIGCVFETTATCNNNDLTVVVAVVTTTTIICLDSKVLIFNPSI